MSRPDCCVAGDDMVHRGPACEPIAFDWVAHRWTHRIGDDEDAEYDYRDARHVCPIPAANDTVEGQDAGGVKFRSARN